jgi:hypothetical protein
LFKPQEHDRLWPFFALLEIGFTQKVVLSVRISGRVIIAQQFTAGVTTDEI